MNWLSPIKRIGLAPCSRYMRALRFGGAPHTNSPESASRVWLCWKCLVRNSARSASHLAHKSSYTPQRAKVKDNPHCLSWLKSSRDSSGGAQITLLGLQYRNAPKLLLFCPSIRGALSTHTHIYIYFPPQMMVKAKSPGASLDIPTTNERKSNTAGAVWWWWRRRWFISGDCSGARQQNVRHAAPFLLPFFVFAPTAAPACTNCIQRIIALGAAQSNLIS